MPRSLCITHNVGGSVVTNNQATDLVGSMQVAAESSRPRPIRISGTFSKLALSINNVGASRVLRFRDNTTNGNQSIQLANGNEGIYGASANTETVISGDIVNTLLTEAGTDPTLFWVRNVFQADTNHSSFWGIGRSFGISFNSATQRAPVLGGLPIPSSASANHTHLIKAAGNVAWFYVNITSNARVSDSVFGLEKNGSNSALAVTVGAGLSGLFENLTDSESIDIDDLICIRITNGAGASETMNISTWGATFTNTIANTNDIGGFAGSGTTRAASATEDYWGFGGNVSLPKIDEVPAQFTHGFNGVCKQARVLISANTYADDAVMAVRKDGANGNQSVTVVAGTTGWFEDSVNSDKFSSDSLMNLAISGGTSGSITLRGWAVTEEEDVLPNAVPGLETSIVKNFQVVSY